MKKILFSVLIAVFLTFSLCNHTFAIEDPLTLSNNKVGVHLLFTAEIENAAKLVNGNGGDWGYVVVPIQTTDRDLVKWQKFMDDAKKLHVIPIIRLATAGDYFNTTVWSKPTNEDVLDFANFLNSLSWPVKNRYVVIFNEVNRSDEWEGKLDPAEYARILAYAVSAFKQLNNDYFIISSGLDNAAPNLPGIYMNEYDYMAAMNEAVPGIFGMIDGLGSHSYPNPGFKQLPHILTSKSIYSFSFEHNMALRLSDKNLPVFITETGWSKETLSPTQIGQYFEYAFENVWSDENVVSVNTFLLQAGTKPFSYFSLIDEDGKCNEIYNSIFNLQKKKGEPTLNKDATPSAYIKPINLPIKSFPKKYQYQEFPAEKTDAATDFLKWLLKLYI